MCPRGAFKCSHAAALFIHGIHNLSRTDVECQWWKQKSNTSLSTQAVTEMFPPPKKYSALSRKPTQADRSALYEDLKEYGRFTQFTGLCWLISPEPPLVSQLPFPTMEEIIFSDEFLEATRRQQKLDCLVRRYEAEAIEAFTLKTGLAVKETGIWFHSSGILGASPDGIIDEETVLEVKCPYTERNLTIAEYGTPFMTKR